MTKKAQEELESLLDIFDEQGNIDGDRLFGGGIFNDMGKLLGVVDEANEESRAAGAIRLESESDSTDASPRGPDKGDDRQQGRDEV